MKQAEQKRLASVLGSTLIVWLVMNSGQTVAQTQPTEAEALFARTVWPTLKIKCLACHGDEPSKLKGGLNLAAEADAKMGGDSGQPVVLAGQPALSPLYRAISRTDDEFAPMPPKENDRLSDAEIRAIRRWIETGAPWPSPDRVAEVNKLLAADRAGGVSVKTSAGLSDEWTNRRYDPENLWAYRPLATQSTRGSIDSLVEARLRSLNLAPAPRADRRTLIRRVTFDLTGLPPTPQEIDEFENDPNSENAAFAKVVDRLLASPHYGEQMARHWLDVARYADSSGLANDYERGNAWRYRDFVVRSFNSDKPYNQFVRQQIAGDEIDGENPEMLVAVGFLRMGAWELTGMEVPKVARQRFLDDVTDAVGQVFLGHMLQCARCHDHKFDPVPTRDFYRIQAAFATTQLAERPAAILASESTAGFDERRYLEARQARLNAELKRIQDAESEARKNWQAIRTETTGQKPPRHEFLSTTDLGLERIARKGLERLMWEFDRYEPVALSVYSGRTPQMKSVYAPFRVPKKPLEEGDLESTHILAGGDPFSPKDEVTPGVLSAIADESLPDEITGRRKALAAWITGPANVLAARVMANRIWQWHFGTAIARNPNNFGATGKKPTHPELLDYLARELISNDWSVKHLHRLILMSETYRRSSSHPDSKSLAANDQVHSNYAAFKPRRLSAEEFRDAMLAVSGELNRRVGGIPVRPEIHVDVAFQPRQVMGTFAAAWEPSPKPAERHRRSLYTLKLRGLRDPMMEVLNQPSPDLSCECRESSTVAPQVFALLNGQATQGRALAFAAQLLRTAQSREQAIAIAFRTAFGRNPTDAEFAAGLKHWSEMTARHQNLKLEKPTRPSQITREAVEENTGVKFTFVDVLESSGDFVPDLHPADVGPDVRGLAEVCLVMFNANEFVYVD